MEGAHGGQNISSLMDGELVAVEADREIARLKTDGALREQWDTYHVIGDAMRGSRVGQGGFSARFSERLALEPTVLAPRPRNAGKVQTYALRVAASVAAFAVVGWSALNILKPATPGAELAQNTAAPTAVAVQSPVAAAGANNAGGVAQNSGAAADAGETASQPREAENVKEFLLAHQGISPTTAIQGVAPYVRTVSISGE